MYLANRLPFPYTDEVADWWLNMVKEHDGVDSIFRLITADGVPVGSISVEPKSDVYCRDAEIGYMLLSDEWSKGIATEAVRQICEIAFRKLNIIRITGNVYEPNTASRRVLEKNGFELEGIMKQAVTKNDKIYNLCFVAEADEKIVGAVWVRTSKQYGHIDDKTPCFSISLYPEYRNQGIGTELMKKMIKFLTEKGYNRASLSVQKENYDMGLYSKLGFETIEENNGERIMVKELNCALVKK